MTTSVPEGPVIRDPMNPVVAFSDDDIPEGLAAPRPDMSEDERSALIGMIQLGRQAGTLDPHEMRASDARKRQALQNRYLAANQARRATTTLSRDAAVLSLTRSTLRSTERTHAMHHSFVGQLQQKRDALRTQLTTLLASVDAEDRSTLTASETETFQTMNADLNALDQRIKDILDAEARAQANAKTMEDLERQPVTAPGAQGQRGSLVRLPDMTPAAITAEQRFAAHAVVQRAAATASGREAAALAQYGDLGQLVRAMTTTGGSAVVPTVWFGDVIDRARNLSAVLRAGAQIVPMDAKTVQIGRLTGDPTASFRAEGSGITPSDPTFDNVTLTAQSLNALVIGSMEWFADAQNADDLVKNALANAFASQIDLVSLYGSITSGTINLPTPSNPRGILGTLNATAATSVLGGAVNGTAQTAGAFYNELLDTLYTPSDYNERPNAMIYNTKLARLYAKAYDTTGQPLRAPDDLQNVQRLVSNQIPTYTQGTLTTATDVFAGDFSQLIIGQRLDFTVQVLTERYADNGQIGILASWRGDVALARPRAFAVYRAIKGA